MDKWPPFLFTPIPLFAFEPEVFTDPIFFRFICFAMARTYKYPSAQPHCFNGQTVILEMGEFIFGRMHWAKELNISEDKVRRMLDRLVNQQWIIKNPSKTTSKMTVYKWQWSHFPHSSRRQNPQHDTGTMLPNPPQTKNRKIEKETATSQTIVSTNALVVATSFELNDTVYSLLSSLPIEEQEAIFELLKQSKSTNAIKNINGWIRKCIKEGWHKKAEPRTNSSLEANRKLVHSICHWLKDHPDIRVCIFQDIFEMKAENGLRFQFFYHEDTSLFQSRLLTGIKKLGLNPPAHLFQS